jgi:hypothetical protein
VEVRFTADGAATLVELEHRKFEVLGQEGGEKMRKDVDGGWPGILELFRKAAEEGVEMLSVKLPSCPAPSGAGPDHHAMRGTCRSR